MTKTHLTNRIANIGECNWCVMCASVVLLANCLPLMTGAPADLILAYAQVSSAFALVVGSSLAVRKVLR
jgi:hypothetical protein